MNEDPLPGARLNLIAGPIGSVRRLVLVAGDRQAHLRAGTRQSHINRGAAEALGWPATIVLRNPAKGSSVSFEVQAVIDDGDPGPKVYADLAAYTQYDETVPSRELLSIFATSARSPVEDLSGALERAITQLGLESSAPIARVDGVGELDLGLSSVARSFSVASFVIFAVAALGTANVGLSSVRERRREFAIRPPLPWPAAALGVSAGCGSALIGAAAPAIAVARSSIALALR